MMKRILLAGGALALLASCGGNDASEMQETTVQIIEIAQGEGFAARLQTALITADADTTIVMPAGTYTFTDGLSLDVKGVTLRGAGEDKTFLDFSGQKGAGEGLLVTSADVTLRDFTIRDTAGDGIKSKGADNITYRDLTVEWTGEPDASNGAYGVYPVESSNVLVDGVTVRGASDAGIYVGQSSQIIVRNSLAEYNVAGIEIENSTFADVYKNTARHNAGGVLIFDLPNLPIMGGHSTRVFDNDIYDNNTKNFAPPGNIVATVPSGTGVIIMANENIHIFGNRFANNRTVQIVIGAYPNEFDDAKYNPLPRNIVVRDNSYNGGGNDPQGMMTMLAAAMGGKLPPVVWDGVTSWGGGEAVDVNLSVTEVNDIGFVSLGLGSYPLDPAKMRPGMMRPKSTAKAEPEPIKLAHDFLTTGQ
ncbi:MAG: right-handed parallel beta-helix repeat-containing protein [Robiginitomaculum sp.]|nr:right-handed parallel beta-helix repeat-containing protein [Robiginitomaculum sp.]